MMSAIDPEDAIIVRECRAGSLTAFDRLIQRHHGQVFAFLLTLTRQRQDAEDLTQETFLRAWRKFDRYNPELPLMPWLLTIARRLSISMLRKRKPLPEEIPEPIVLPPEEPDLEVWRVAEMHLSSEAFSALWLHYRDDMPLAEVGRVLGKKEGAVKVMLHRARKALAGHLRNPSPKPPPMPVSVPPPLPSIWKAEVTS